MHDVDVEKFFERGFYDLKPWIAKFKHLVGVGENDVVMLPVLEGTLEQRSAVAKEMFSDQCAVQ